MSDFASKSSSPRRIRESNASAAIQALFGRGCLSRAELARQLGLNRSSSGHIVAELTASELVREVAEDTAPRKRESRTPARAGRPGILLELVPEAAFFLGAEIGVEHITTVAIDLNAEVVACRVVPFEGRAVSADEAIRSAVAQALDGLPELVLDRCEGFGLSAPAQMPERGHVTIAPILGWRDVDIGALFEAALPIDVPVMVENEANAFAIGEGYLRRDSRRGVTLSLVVETGVGGGIVIDGELMQGGHRLAGEIGHLRIPEADGAELEALIGYDPVMRRYKAAGGRQDAELEDFISDVRDRAPAAVTIAEDWARYLASALVQACRLIDPNRIVLGGALAALYPMVAARVEMHMRALQADTFPFPDIVLHDVPELGAAFGAACMLHQRFISVGSELIEGDAGSARRSAGQAAR